MRIQQTGSNIEGFIKDNQLDNLTIVHIQKDDNGMYDAIRSI